MGACRSRPRRRSRRANAVGQHSATRPYRTLFPLSSNDPSYATYWTSRSRRIGAQINKGEALHALRGFLFVANEGKIRRRYDEEQLNQVSCLNLVTNAVVLWNTVYLSAVLDQLRTEDHNVDDGDVVHLSPARYAHINPYGKYRFNVEGEFHRKGLRPLRRPDSVMA